MVGIGVGKAIRAGDGLTDAIGVGTRVGAEDGPMVGFRVSTPVGAGDGLTVGFEVGTPVGARDGPMVGFGVGSSAGGDVEANTRFSQQFMEPAKFCKAYMIVFRSTDQQRRRTHIVAARNT